MHNTGLLSTHA